jgi:hypothetical protein
MNIYIYMYVMYMYIYIHMYMHILNTHVRERECVTLVCVYASEASRPGRVVFLMCC